MLESILSLGKGMAEPTELVLWWQRMTWVSPWMLDYAYHLDGPKTVKKLVMMIWNFITCDRLTLAKKVQCREYTALEIGVFLSLQDSYLDME